jgi:hypothetical protein
MNQQEFLKSDQETGVAEIIHLQYWTNRRSHYRRSLICRVLATHGEIGKAHGKYFAVCLLSANTARQRTPRQIGYAVRIDKNARRNFCRVLPLHTRERKATQRRRWPGWGRNAVCRGLRVCREPSPRSLPCAVLRRVPCVSSLPCAVP